MVVASFVMKHLLAVRVGGCQHFSDDFLHCRPIVRWNWNGGSRWERRIHVCAAERLELAETDVPAPHRNDLDWSTAETSVL